MIPAHHRVIESVDRGLTKKFNPFPEIIGGYEQDQAVMLKQKLD